MPMSNPWHLATVLHFVEKLNPKSVLDVGIGMGTYGFMVRQFLDISQERLKRSDWKLRIDGVEIFEAYRNPLWEYAYDSVVLRDIWQALPELGAYDVVICNDVLEHFPKATAQSLIQMLLEHAPVVIATTPNRHWEQGAWGGNEAETHHCLLEAESIPHLCCEVRTGATSCFLISKDIRLAAVLKQGALTCPQVKSPRSSRLWHRIARKLQSLGLL